MEGMAAHAAVPATEPELAEQVAVLQDATRVLTGVALRSMAALNGVVTLAQFRLLAVLTDLGRARSSQAARALGLDASTVTRLADRMVAAGHVARGSDPAHRSVVTLELTPSGRQLVAAVSAVRDQELRRLLDLLPPGCRSVITQALRQLVAAAGEGYGVAAPREMPL
jgi:DNA-binding MarR family transcriptional regulator